MKKFGHSIKSLFVCKRGKRGESLTEALASIAIGALALVMLAMAISVSTRMATDSRSYMHDYYEANSAVVSGESGNEVGSGQLALSASDGSTIALAESDSIDVKYYDYRDEKFDVVLYNYDKGTGGTP